MARYPALAEKLKKFDDGRPTPEYALKLDGWLNNTTLVGTPKDKVQATVFQDTTGRLMPSELEDLYHNDDVAARICDLIPETSMRVPFQLDDQELLQKMYALGACEAFKDAWIWGRLHGGGPIVLGGPGASSTPLTGGVNSLFVADRFTLAIARYYDDPASPKYGQPMLYQIMRPAFTSLGNPVPTTFDPTEQIHESRVIVFPGARTSPRRKIANGGWDDSVLQRVYQVVQAYGITWASVVHLLQDAAQGVYKMKDLWNMLVGGQKDVVEERMRVVDENRSSARMILTDADSEDFTRVPTPFSGIPELIDRISERLASASGYPLTVLMGSSPAGMNATGQSDLENFYGKCDAQRVDKVTPAVMKLAAAMGYDPAALTITYPPLWMPTDKEKAETRYATAQADNIYFQMGLKPKAILVQRFTKAGWSPNLTVTEQDVGDPPQVAAAAAAAKPGAQEGEGASTAIGTHHFSPKYGR